MPAAASSSPSAATPAVRSPARAYWLKTLHQWHWVSAAVCLLGMLLFSVTGVTLNHASQIESRPVVRSVDSTVPASLLAVLTAEAARHGDKAQASVPPAFGDWLASQFGVDARGREAEWSADEVYLSLPEPGGDAWVRVDLADGAAEYEHTARGWIAYLNDLHKGRHTGEAWRWFIDAFAVACLVFSITGLFILKLHAANRPSTWPVVGLGVVLPLLLALLFIH